MPRAGENPGSREQIEDREASRMRHRRILYVGPLLADSTTIQRLHALQAFGYEISTVTTAKPAAHQRLSLFARVRNRFLGKRDRTGANGRILSELRTTPFDLLWIDKGLTVHPQTLQNVRRTQPSCLIVGFSPDDMMNPRNQSRCFLRGLRLYDWYITNKSYNVAELKALGCPRVVFMDNGFDPATHRPMPVSAEERKRFGGAVGFIGQWEPHRAGSLRALAQAGVPVRVWGYTWERMKNVPDGLTLENRPLWGDDYAKAICAFDINLCFLRKCNRDLQTTRSVEIPACGAFMLAERTVEHLRLFREGVEAEFFSSDAELVTKTYSYLGHPEKRRLMAQQGYLRCQAGGYDYSSRLRPLLQQIFHERAN